MNIFFLSFFVKAAFFMESIGPGHNALLPIWLRPIRPAEYLYLSISVFPLETSICLERLPLERERFKKKIARKTLDGELKQANTSDWHAQLVD